MEVKILARVTVVAQPSSTVGWPGSFLGERAAAVETSLGSTRLLPIIGHGLLLLLANEARKLLYTF